jgi:hypothetical protein
VPEEPIRIDVEMTEEDAERGLRDLERQSKKAFRQFERDTRRGEKAGKRFGSMIGGIKGKLAALAAGVSLVAIGKKSISAFIEQERAVMRVQAALKLQGITSRATRKDLEEYASSLQRVTIHGDEAALAGIAVALNMGATAEQAKELVAVSADLADAMGRDLNESIRQVTKTLGGYAGELGEIIPELKQLSPDQLRAGGAARILRERFGGSAQAIAQTEGGRLQQTMNTLGDNFEKLGARILPAFNWALEKVVNFIDKYFPGPEERPITLAEELAAKRQGEFASLLAQRRALNQRLTGFGLQGLGEPTMRGIMANWSYNPMDVWWKSFSQERFHKAVMGDIQGSFIEGDLNQLQALRQAMKRMEAVPTIGQAGRGVIDAIGAPSREMFYSHQRSGIQAGHAAYVARLGLTEGNDPGDVLRARADRERDAALRRVNLAELAETEPQLLQFTDDLGMGVQTSVEEALRTAFTGGSVQEILDSFSQALAGAVTSALAEALASKLIAESGLLKGTEDVALAIGSSTGAN